MRYFRNTFCFSLVFVIAMQIMYLALDAPGSEPEMEDTQTPGFNCIVSCVKYVVKDLANCEVKSPQSKNIKHKTPLLHKHLRPVPGSKTLLADDGFREYAAADLPEYFPDKYAFQFIKEINPPPGKA